MSGPDYVMYDLDGCVSDDRWRRHLLPDPESKSNEPPDYAPYHDLMSHDVPVLLMVHKIRQEMSEGRVPLFVTCRPRMYRARTADWIRTHVTDGDEFKLLMRDRLLPSPRMKVDLLKRFFECNKGTLIAAWDDRQDVLDAIGAAYPDALTVQFSLVDPAPPERPAPESPEEPPTYFGEEPVDVEKPPQPNSAAPAMVLEEMIDVYNSRNLLYRDNYRRSAEVIRALFPDGVPPDVLHSARYHLFVQLVSKISRFAASNLQHRDSILDAGVYCAIIASEVEG